MTLIVFSLDMLALCLESKWREQNAQSSWGSSYLLCLCLQGQICVNLDDWLEAARESNSQWTV